ncbi:ATP-binding cassette domain-containing protein [bacterium]|nr:ATP-binding cassette domain-containing protein [bacterium]
MALATLSDLSIGFGGPPLLEGARLQIQKNERVCLLGRNGAGKSTLLKIITGDLNPDFGTVSLKEGIRVALLGQDIPDGIGPTIRDAVSEHAPETLSGPPVVDTVLSQMGLDGRAPFESLSVGMKRRTLLTRALATQPDLLLLDEPTNHLDIDAILWLEDFLRKRRGARLFITHDRSLTQRLATRIVEIEMGHLKSWNCDYRTYLHRREAQQEADVAQSEQFARKLSEEEAWIRRGIQARRTRNQGRVRALERAREERHRRRKRVGEARIQLQEAEKTSRRIIEAKNLTFSYGYEPVIEDFGTTILRGDKIGLIGPNGSGKTTLLRLLLGDLSPQAGSVSHGLRLEVAYFDQTRAQLDDSKTVFDSVANGSDRLSVNGKIRHVYAYLEDFLFPRSRSRSLVRVLSGGERNRLLLAKLFATPANVLALDEPTNDLDTETLEILEATLVEFSGTVLVVSHDRTFLDNVVTSTIVLDEGKTTEYVGGYNDYLRQRPERSPAPAPTPKEKVTKPQSSNHKLSNKERIELDEMPDRIDALESERDKLHKKLSDPAVYQNGADIPPMNARLAEIDIELDAALERWEELDALST